MDSRELREKFLDFFKEKGHAVIPSASLVPENDPTTLFTSAGMQPMIPFLMGEKHPLGTRIVDSQKCFRSQDIEEVGDNRHTTFFEMLGNWSFGDYFKTEQIEWIFDFIVKELKLDPKRLYVTVFRGNSEIGIPKDEETVALWQKKFAEVGIEARDIDLAEKNGMQDGRIFYYDEKKNWWSRSGVPVNMPIGEIGGPDSEMFWDFGANLHLHENSPFKDLPCHVNCDCGRFMEIGNSVFIQYIKTEKGFELLSQKNVDFGGGLERMLAAKLNDPDIFHIDLLQPLINEVEKISGVKYNSNQITDSQFRVIVDHLRAATFLINDGVIPSNKEAGYILRRLIRRAIVKAQQLGIKENFTTQIARKVFEAYIGVYEFDKERVVIELEKEEQKFRNTLAKGLKQFDMIKDNLDGKKAFDLYQTYGFPWEMTAELAKEQEIEVDIKEFEKAFKEHQELSRTASAGMFKGGLADAGDMAVKYHTATHLLHAALRKILGEHVEQKGSNITAERLRFDFSHPEKMSPEQIKAVEDLVNEQIQKDLPVTLEEMSPEAAKNSGALGFFAHKYGDKVKVYTIGESKDNYFSKEICGGPHVDRIGILGKFKISKEEASSAGIRRIKAVLE